jgi:hypothetical protein
MRAMASEADSRVEGLAADIFQANSPAARSPAVQRTRGVGSVLGGRFVNAIHNNRVERGFTGLEFQA